MLSNTLERIFFIEQVIRNFDRFKYHMQYAETMKKSGKSYKVIPLTRCFGHALGLPESNFLFWSAV